jgi:hypothetical protein
MYLTQFFLAGPLVKITEWFLSPYLTLSTSSSSPILSISSISILKLGLVMILIPTIMNGLQVLNRLSPSL